MQNKKTTILIKIGTSQLSQVIIIQGVTTYKNIPGGVNAEPESIHNRLRINKLYLWLAIVDYFRTAA